MLIRISLIVAIVVGLAVGTLNFVKIKEIVADLRTQRDQQTERANTAETQLASTRSELEKTTADLKQTAEALETTTTERNQAVAVAEEKTQAAARLAEELAKAQTDLNDTRANLAAYVATGLSPAQAAGAAKQIRQLEDMIAGSREEGLLLAKAIRRLENELAKYKPNNPPVILPAGLIGKVVTSDPKWDFVVLDVGGEQGILERGELLVSRNGQLVAKVKVTSVQKDRSIANVMPGWKLGEVLEGDQVIPAHPSSS